MDKIQNVHFKIYIYYLGLAEVVELVDTPS